MSSADKRIHARVEIRGEARISGPNGVFEGQLHDLSKGGASVFLGESIGAVGETVEMFLPLPADPKNPSAQDDEIAVSAEILRQETTKQGILHGLRFNLVEPSMQEKLNAYLENLLLAKGPRTRQHPRIAKRIPIAFKQLDELQAMLRNISLGGLSMVVNSPLVLYEEIEVSLPDSENHELLVLRAQVLHQYREEKGGKIQYQVGLKFLPMSQVAQRCLKELIEYFLGLSK